MSLFGKILERLGLRRDGDATPTPAGDTAGTPTGTAATPATTAAAPAAAAAPAPIRDVDVAAQLQQRAATAGQPLNWRNSIVDLLKLLDLDSSLEARRGLATELGCPADKMQDSAQMNMWLHREVLSRLAAHGGKLPPELTH